MSGIKIRTGQLGLQGGGSACAFTAGVLYSLLGDTSLEFNRVTGTSGGALCGAAITQAINKFGYGEKGRKTAQKRLVDQWNDIAQPDHAAVIGRHIDRALRLNPFLYTHMKTGYSHSMDSHLNKTTLNPNALQGSRHIELIVNAVDNNGNHKLFSGKELDVNALKASGALPSHFHSVNINRQHYWDGAVLGGANPPIQPLLKKRSDFLLFIMTNPPQHPITPRLQSDLTKQDVAQSDNLILHHAYDEIALLLSRREKGDDIPPVHIIYPDIDRPWNTLDKQMIEKTVIEQRFHMGLSAGEAFKKAHGSTLHKRSSLSLKSLQNMSQKGISRSLVAA